MVGILAIDQGTTSSRAIIFDQYLKPQASGQHEFPQIFPKNGWVEHNPENIWESTIQSCQTAMNQYGETPVAIGITNQRETVIVWDKHTGQPIYNAIVWQDRRTTDFCSTLKRDGLEQKITQYTGLLLDPYFSASKLTWILKNISSAAKRATTGDLLFGTVDTYLIWRLTGGRQHVTDLTNACRTMLVNLHTGQWDQELLDLFEIPRSMLPEILECADEFGSTDESIFGSVIPIRGVAGDQHAASIGQACFTPGMLKATYGTGCFALLNTGENICSSSSRLLTTVAYRLKGETHYALEGSIFVAGAVIQWLRDGLGIIGNASHSGGMAEKADSEQQLYIVPAFTGLGAPYWDSECRGAIFGLTRNSGPNEFAKAALESVCYQTKDLILAMQSDVQFDNKIVLRVDGGMAASDWTMQNIANLLGIPVDRPRTIETTSLGAAYLAGLQTGLCPEPEEFADQWHIDKRFEPIDSCSDSERKYAGWLDAVRRTLSQNR